jgi:hypothetical protein
MGDILIHQYATHFKTLLHDQVRKEHRDLLHERDEEQEQEDDLVARDGKERPRGGYFSFVEDGIPM